MNADGGWAAFGGKVAERSAPQPVADRRSTSHVTSAAGGWATSSGSVVDRAAPQPAVDKQPVSPLTSVDSGWAAFSNTNVTDGNAPQPAADNFLAFLSAEGPSGTPGRRPDAGACRPSWAADFGGSAAPTTQAAPAWAADFDPLAPASDQKTAGLASNPKDTATSSADLAEVFGWSAGSPQ